MTQTIKCHRCGWIQHTESNNCLNCARALTLVDVTPETLRTPRAERTDSFNKWLDEKYAAFSKADAADRELYAAISKFVHKTTIKPESRGFVIVTAQRLAEDSIELGMNRTEVENSPVGFVQQACVKLGVPAFTIVRANA